LLLVVMTRKGLKVLLDLYEPMRKANAPILVTDRTSAELIKYASNAFLAVKISFINEMSRLAEKAKADISKIALGMGMDKRIGPSFLLPGPGYGGSCFPKDTKALLKIASDFGVPLRIVESSVIANEEQAKFAVEKIVKNLPKTCENPTIAILGLAFKGGTDDVRESPSLKICKDLMEKGFKLKCYDPEASVNALKEIESLNVVPSIMDACKDSDIVVIATEWNEFKTIDLKAVKEVMATPVIVDLRNLLDREKAIEEGFKYDSIGKVFE